MTDFVFTRYGLHGGDSCTRSPSGRLSGPLSIAQSPHHVPLPAGRQLLRNRQGRVGGAVRKTLRFLVRLLRECRQPVSRLWTFSNQVLPASGARSVRASSWWPSPAKVEDSARHVERNERPSSPCCCTKVFSATSLTLNGFSLCPKCSGSISSTTASFWESWPDSPTRPSAR